METNSTQQEILLITGTTFSERQWSEKDENSNDKNLSAEERLEEACWNGFLQELLPELFDRRPGAAKLYLWQIEKGNSFLELDLGEYKDEKDASFSIDPYTFMATQEYN